MGKVATRKVAHPSVEERKARGKAAREHRLAGRSRRVGAGRRQA